MSHGSRENKIAGCLLGGAIGDALGAPVEFWTLEKIRSQCGETGVRKFLPARYGNAPVDNDANFVKLKCMKNCRQSEVGQNHPHDNA